LERLEKLQKEGIDRPEIDISTLPTSVDWRDQNVISAVKDQGKCGSCWSFGTAESIESHWALATGQLQDLSEQQILDCTPNPNACGGTGGCGGGIVELGYQKIIDWAPSIPNGLIPTNPGREMISRNADFRPPIKPRPSKDMSTSPRTSMMLSSMLWRPSGLWPSTLMRAHGTNTRRVFSLAAT
jgi:hypothetical protein